MVMLKLIFIPIFLACLYCFIYYLIVQYNLDNKNDNDNDDDDDGSGGDDGGGDGTSNSKIFVPLVNNA